MASYTRDEVLTASLDYFGGDDLAAKTFVDKYALHKEDTYYELTPAGMHDRLTDAFFHIEERYDGNCPPHLGLPRKAIRDGLDHFRKIVPGGSPMHGVGNPWALVSLSNCVAIASPEDNISSIYERARDLANLFKRRCGVGIDISTLRPDGASVTNSAKTSSGAWSFAELYSYVSQHTAQQGRRGAMMITMNIGHPDVVKFVTMKRDLTKVTSANISVMITDAFMAALESDGMWYLTFPPLAQDTKLDDWLATVDGPHTIEIRARDLWRLICKTATDTAEPGIIFIDNYRRNLPLEYYPDFKSVCVNPCSEILLSAYDSCRLMSLNLKGFIVHPHRDDAEFDWEDFKVHVNIAMRLLDDLVDLEIAALKRIVSIADTEDERQLFVKMCHAAKTARRTGLGTHGLADALAALHLRYDDPEKAREMIAGIYSTLRNEAYRASIQLAIERGPFPAFDWKLEKNCPYLRNLPEDIYDALAIWGRRNGALLTNAPTGTVSIMSQTSSGIEPVFANNYVRRRKLADDKAGRVDFTDAQGDKFEEHTVWHRNVEEYRRMHKPEDALPSWFITAPQIDWSERVKIQGLIQTYIDHGISSTINLPKGTKVETVERLYREAYKSGLKGLTVYVDGSRDGVLLAEPQDWSQRPEVLPCEIHHVEVTCKGVTQQFTILVSFKDGRPFEVFGGESKYLGLPPKFKQGTIKKIKYRDRKNRYQLEVRQGTVQDLGDTFQNNDYAALSRLISLALRNGTPLVSIVDQLRREQDELFTYSKVIARVLKRYIADGTRSTVRCDNCGSKSLRFEESCVTCTDCGYSGCG